MTLERFAALHHQVTVGTAMGKVLERGARGLSMLERVATVWDTEFIGDRLGSQFLPWYEDGDWGEGAWWTGGLPLTVARYADRYKTEQAVPHRDQVAKFVAKAKQLRSLGPSLAVEDTGLGVTVLVDGCKRACASYLVGMGWPVLVLKSRWAHMFYPYEFLPHILSMEMPHE